MLPVPLGFSGAPSASSMAELPREMTARISGAPAGASEEQTSQALRNAQREVLFLRRELFKLQAELPANDEKIPEEDFKLTV